jgi:integrase/recombinase XerD
MTDQLPTKVAPARVSRMLTAAEFRKLADVPPEIEWFANLTNVHTRRAYEKAVKDFMHFTGIKRPEEFRVVTRAHVIAWRDDLRTRVTRRGEPWSDASTRHRLSALASLFEYLCDRNAVTHNPVKGVARPKSESGEGKTPALGDHQARKLLDAPDGNPTRPIGSGRLSDVDDSTRNKRDRAILSTLLFHALRREELCKLKVKDFRHTRKGVPHLSVPGKGGKKAISAAASRHPCAHSRISHCSRPRRGRERRTIPANP